MLKVENLHVSYGHIEVLKGISFSVEMGEIVALIGGNGAGKNDHAQHDLRPSPADIGQKSRGRARRSRAWRLKASSAPDLAHCPEGRAHLSRPDRPRESHQRNSPRVSYNKKEIDESLTLVFDLFPRLKERIKQGGWSLSGGEQQMLAIGRALMSRPKPADAR